MDKPTLRVSYLQLSLWYLLVLDFFCAFDHFDLSLICLWFICVFSHVFPLNGRRSFWLCPKEDPSSKMHPACLKISKISLSDVQSWIPRTDQPQQSCWRWDDSDGTSDSESDSGTASDRIAYDCCQDVPVCSSASFLSSFSSLVASFPCQHWQWRSPCPAPRDRKGEERVSFGHDTILFLVDFVEFVNFRVFLANKRSNRSALALSFSHPPLFCFLVSLCLFPLLITSHMRSGECCFAFTLTQRVSADFLFFIGFKKKNHAHKAERRREKKGDKGKINNFRMHRLRCFLWHLLTPTLVLGCWAPIGHQERAFPDQHSHWALQGEDAPGQVSE